jgi:hypothetical protein
MGGKAALIIIAGFSSIVMLLGANNTNVSQTVSHTFVDHYANELAHQIAVSGANIACNRFFVSPAWSPSTTGVDDADYNGGTLDVTTELIDQARGRVRVISTGTFMGETRRITVVMQATSFGKFALFVNSMGTGGAYYPAGTRITGPVHINVPFKNGVPDPAQSFRVDGGTYEGKVTSDLMWTAAGSKVKPNFVAGFEDKVHVTLPNEFDQKLKDAVTTGTYKQDGTQQLGFKFTDSRNVAAIFGSDAGGNGTITYKEFALTDSAFYDTYNRLTPPSDPTAFTAAGWKTKRLSELAGTGKEFNGGLYLKNGNFAVKGEVNGRITLGAVNVNTTTGAAVEAAAVSSSTKAYYNKSKKQYEYFSVDPKTSFGNVWLDGDITYKHDPATDANSTDLFGVVATNYIFATDNQRNNTTKLITSGSYFSKFKGATTENLYNLPNMKIDGSTLLDWEYRGGWTEGSAQLTTTTNGKGYDQIYKYDQRLMKDSPPFFPATGALSILSWLEE